MYNVGPRGVLYKQKYVFFVCGDISPRSTSKLYDSRTLSRTWAFPLLLAISSRDFQIGGSKWYFLTVMVY